MRTAAVAFAVSALVSVVLTPLVRDLALRFGWLDHALTSRKIHGKPIPRLGGIAIVAAFYAPLVALLVVDSGTGRLFLAEGSRASGLFFGGLAIATLGIWDDVHGAGAKTKFLAQFAVAYAMFRLGFRVEEVVNPFGAPIQLGGLALPFTMLWIVGVINAVNLIDGLDGLAGGVALIGIGTTFVIAFQREQPLMLLFAASLAGAVLGFLRYNFNPASIFMGDTGSMFLGFVLATSAIQTHQKSSTAVAMVVPIVALGLPIGDTLLAITRRAIRGVPLFHSDKGHIHHRLMAKGLSHRQTVLVLYAVCALLGAAAIALVHTSGAAAAAVLGGVALLATALLSFAGYIRVGGADQLLAERRRNLEMRSSVEEIGRMLQTAAQPYDVWRCVRRGALAVGARSVELKLVRSSGDERVTKTYSVGPDAAADLFRARFSLRGERPDDAGIELGWSDGRSALDRDTETAVELLCEHVRGAVNRIYADRENDLGPMEAANDVAAGVVVPLRQKTGR